MRLASNGPCLTVEGHVRFNHDMHQSHRQGDPVRDVDYDTLQRCGWRINAQKGIVRRGYASVSLCLHIDGRRHVCLPGAGQTYGEALLGAVSAANRWIRDQRPSHPARQYIATYTATEQAND